MKIKNLSSHYGKKQILHDITFSLKPHSFTALIGKNGSGKSTLLDCINGQVRYTGQILLDGKPIEEYPPKERAQRIAYLPQFFPPSALTAEELIALGRTPYLGLGGKLQPEDRQKIDEAIQKTDTQPLRHRLIATLSGGERQKVYLAMLLAQDADILMLDEPTAHMDMGYTAEFLSLLRTLSEHQGKTVLAVLHNLNDAVTYAHEILLLDDGQLKAAEQAEQIFGVRKICYIENGKTKYFYQ